MIGDDSIFVGWHGHYRDEYGKRATLSILERDGDIVLITTTGDRLRFSTLEAGLLLDGLAAAIRAAGAVP